MGTSPGTAAASGRRLPFPQLIYFETHPEHPAVVEAARQWQVATIFRYWFGGATPGRPSSHLAELSHPDHIPASCPRVECRDGACRGNRLERSEDGEEYILIVPHSKTQPGLISFPLCPSMWVWMEVWTRWCWSIVAKGNTSRLFCTLVNGLPFSDSNLTKFFQVGKPAMLALHLHGTVTCGLRCRLLFKHSPSSHPPALFPVLRKYIGICMCRSGST